MPIFAPLACQTALDCSDGCNQRGEVGDTGQTPARRKARARLLCRARSHFKQSATAGTALELSYRYGCHKVKPQFDQSLVASYF